MNLFFEIYLKLLILLYNNSANTKFTGKSIHFLPSCHSTNTEAMALVRAQKATNGLTVITNEQTAGRGQHGNTWLSTPNLNLTFSVIFFPEHLKVQNAFQLNIISSLAVLQTLKEFIPSEKDIMIKWPNDIYVGPKKISGILIENTLRGDQIHSVVMGIGINVNQIVFDLPLATSLLQEAGKELDLQQLFTKLCEKLEYYYLKLEAGSKTGLHTLYLNKLLGLNKTRSFADAEGVFLGIIRGINENGALQIEKETGRLQSYSFKEVAFLNSSTK